MAEILVVGGGSWGTAFAHYLTTLGRPVRLWVREEEVIASIRRCRENRIFLPGIQLNQDLVPVADLAVEAARSDILILAVPSKFMRAVMTGLVKAAVRRPVFVNLSKGFEADSLKTISQVAQEVFGIGILDRWVTLSGPSFARELASLHPTAIVGASPSAALLKRIQKDFSSTVLRIYRSDDLTGVEVGGAVKNVMAIAAGMSNGLGYGTNTTASLVTRASVEIMRLGVALKGKTETFWGLAGIGDLMLTCFGSLSRNFQLGRQIALGKSLAEVENSSPMVAEGIETAKAVKKIADRMKIEMPISQQVHQVLFNAKSPRAALADLMARSLKVEWNSN